MWASEHSSWKMCLGMWKEMWNSLNSRCGSQYFDGFSQKCIVLSLTYHFITWNDLRGQSLPDGRENPSGRKVTGSERRRENQPATPKGIPRTLLGPIFTRKNPIVYNYGKPTLKKDRHKCDPPNSNVWVNLFTQVIYKRSKFVHNFSYAIQYSYQDLYIYTLNETLS